MLVQTPHQKLGAPGEQWIADRFNGFAQRARLRTFLGTAHRVAGRRALQRGLLSKEQRELPDVRGDRVIG